MSDHDAASDPIDKAYVEAEALLSDEAVRVARRERVLGAVAREAEAAAAESLPLTPRPVWRRGRWLAAAGVAGLGLILATQIYPDWRGPRTAQVGPAAPTPAASSLAAVRALPPPPAAAPPPPPIAVVPRASPPVLVQTVPPQSVPPPAPPPPAEPTATAPAPEAFPAAPAPPPPQESVIVTAERRSSREARADQDASRAADAAAPPTAASRFAAAPSDQAAKLRAAAAAGRTTEVEALLAQGVPVDAADGEGDTALMDSIQAGHPATAARLRRHGASLDRKNDAGESARDMATAKGDAALDQALGLSP
ncbi:MAG TPA: ankyrin repeat domain-containing protein [Caulobacteraceae bacterium]